MSLGRTNRLIVEAARRLGVRAEPLSDEPSDYFLVLRDEARAVIVSKTRSPFLTQVAQTLSNNKHVSREHLRSQGVACVPDLLVDGEDVGPARAMLREHGTVVVKPNWGNRGLGVSVGIRDEEALARACAQARARDLDEEAVVEPQVEGINLRVAVIGGRCSAAAEVRRPVLVGDGERSPAALVAALNEDGRRGAWPYDGLSPIDRIEVDRELRRLLAQHGARLDEPLPAGQHIELVGEEIETIDRSDELHPGWGELAARACALLGVDVGGVDLRGPAEAFRLPPPQRWAPGAAGLLEVNVLPALHVHALPTHGTARPVFEEFVAYCLQRPGAPPPRAEVELARRI
ncbi:MAG: hypothetical protein H6712_00405 [Myxococcales bacterium]|nr:hypothetical protein [Myxococcales bacterium]MCB9712286.1 hypothetical protein [Myxococcales bacterium]